MASPQPYSIRAALSTPESRPIVLKALERIERNMHKSPDGNGCRQITYAMRGSNCKYPVMKIEGHTVYCHTLLAIAWCWKNNISLPWPADWSVSHDCQNRLCGIHISVQPHSKNQDREYCCPPVECRVCNIRVVTCECSPPCVKRVRSGMCNLCK